MFEELQQMKVDFKKEIGFGSLYQIVGRGRSLAEGDDSKSEE